jgi:phytanoyl-CoA hydroxylase
MATAFLSPRGPAFADQPLPQQIKANKGRVEGTQLGWLRPTSMDTPLEEMRRRLKEDDYVYLKGALPREHVLKMREHYFKQFEGTALLDPNKSPGVGIYNPREDAINHKSIGWGDPEGEELKRLIAAHVMAPYLDFVNHPKLRTLVQELMGWDKEVLLQRTMLRHNVPGGESTGVHYDKLFLRGGDAFFLTAWVPIGDIIPSGGGLIYLNNGRRLGEAIEDDFSARAKDFTAEEKISAFNRNMTDIGILSNHPAQFEDEHRHIAEREGWGSEYKWLVANYEAGDVVFHHPCSVHASCSNEDPEGRIRLSTDLRFYDKRDYDEGKADNRWMKLWSPGDGL